MRGSVRIGRLAGIPIGIHPLWLVIVGLISWSLGRTYFPDQAPGIGHVADYALGLLSALLLFGSILLHELGHALVARRNGVEIEEIDLWLLGGVARMRGEPERAEDELRFALAGPLVTLVIAAVFGGLRAALGATGAPDWLLALVAYQAYVNAAILVLNLLPAFPLDGGRVLRAGLWRRGGDQLAATDRAAAISRGFGWALIALGVLGLASGAAGGIWLALIGGFLLVASGAEAQHLRLERGLAGRTVADVMASPAISLPADATIAEAVEGGFARHLFTSFPVVDAHGHAIGLLTIDQARALDHGDRARVAVGDAAERDPDLLVDAALPLADLMSRPAFARVGRAAVVARDGGLVGIVSASEVDRLLRAAELSPARGTSTAQGRGGRG